MVSCLLSLALLYKTFEQIYRHINHILVLHIHTFYNKKHGLTSLSGMYNQGQH